MKRAFGRHPLDHTDRHVSARMRERLTKLFQSIAAPGRRIAWESRGVWEDDQIEAFAGEHEVAVAASGPAEGPRNEPRGSAQAACILGATASAHGMVIGRGIAGGVAGEAAACTACAAGKPACTASAAGDDDAFG